MSYPSICRRVRGRIRRFVLFRPLRAVTLGPDDGMSTAEYAVGTIAAVAFAAILYGVVTGAPVVSGLSALVQRALAVKL
ncbi:MAG TPA: DUF4244 domain-containing protein [Pseudonocardiaceae bacterium]|jgi:hypothetical protein|nr:DUF4244 domain-containing protein [Pseudonocardiaceae bacterium]